jgi:hypothetical protein
VLLDTIVVPASGAFEQDVLLPHLDDGEHRIIARGTTAKGGAIERQYPFSVAGGALSRIGAAYDVAVPAANATPTEASGDTGVVTDQPVTEPASSGGGFPVVPALLVLAAAGGLGFLVWRIRQRRAAEATGPGERTSTAVASGPLNLRGMGTGSTVGAGRSR